MLSVATSVGLIVAVTIAAISDVLSRRIPNALTMSAVGLALVLRAAVGLEAFAYGLMGAGLALLVMLPLFAMRGVGGGDAKLLIMVAAFLGPYGFLVALLTTALVGGVMSVVAAANKGAILPILFNTLDLMKWVFTLGRRGERTTLVSPGAVSVPYGVAIAIGSILALYWGAGIS
jgi:prepilin peptidase CpaA